MATRIVTGLHQARPAVQPVKAKTFKPQTISEVYAYAARCKRPPQSVAGQA